MRFSMGVVIVLCGCLLSGCQVYTDQDLARFPTQVISTQPTILPPVLPQESPPVPTALPILTPLPYPQISSSAPQVVLGRSVEGRDIDAWQFGDGPTHIILIGGFHGGYEFNSAQLAQMLIDYFGQNPYDVLPGVHLSIIPLANPDGVVRGGGLAGRLNAHGVDLNRNWDCDWSKQAVWLNIPVNPGAAPFSEPESVALRDFLVAQRPDVVVFYHSAAGIVAAGECDGQTPGADWLPGLLSNATGYPQHRFDYYEVTGDAANWLAKQGIPAVVIELASKDQPEFRRNLSGVIALECRFALERLPDAQHVPAVQRLCF